ncbi:MAG: methyltransferase domain-containing protein [Chlorobiaceae bacterium]
MKSMSECISCSGAEVNVILDFGQQPPSNRFYHESGHQIETHALAVGQCALCGLVQLINPMPEAMVRSHYSWITYNEPEGHLDRMVQDLKVIARSDAGARIVGLTYKDDTTLGRFNRLGFDNTFRFSAEEDLGITDPLSGLETVQSSLTPGRAARLVQKYGQTDIMIVRHLLEHAHAPLRLLESLAGMVKPSGFLAFEVPGSKTFLSAFDYSFVWEEHIAYFTEETLGRLMQNAGFEFLFARKYDYPLEDSLLAVVRPASRNRLQSAPGEEEIALGYNFGNHFAEAGERTRRYLQRLKSEGKRVAIFGAGHLAAKFLNFFDLRELVCCVVDDNPHKIGMYMPGSTLPVLPSTALIEKKIDLCLLSLSPESEKKVIESRQAYLEQGGRFSSIFAQSKISFQREAI